jgi:hypothetical protein
MSVLPRTIGATLAAAALVLAAAVPVAAASPEPTSTPTVEESGGPGSVCTYNLHTGTERCFDSYPEMTAVLTGGRLVLHHPRELTDEKVAQYDAAVQAEASGEARAAGRAAPAPAFLIGALFVNAGWDMDAAWKHVEGRICDRGDRAQKFPRMPEGYNDRVSSFYSYNNCETTLYEHTNSGGRSYGPKKNASIGALWINDEASSMEYYAA